MDRRLAALSLALVLAAEPFASRPRADGEPGFGLEPLPAPLTTVTWTLSNVDVLVLGESGLYLYDADGTFLHTVASFGLATSGAAGLAVDPAETFAVTAHFDLGGVHRVDLATGAFTQVGFGPNGGFVIADPDTVIYPVSLLIAGVLEVHRFHLSDGSDEKLIQMEGLVGDVDLDAAGNLYVAQVPDLASSSDEWEVLRFTAAQVAAGGLSASDGVPVLEGRVDLRSFDVTDDASRLFFSEDLGGGQGRLYQLVRGQAPAPLADLGVRPAFHGVQFVPGAGPAAFLPYQPPGGGAVHVVGTGPSRSRVAPLRPSASVSGPGLSGTGPFDVELADGPPGGFALVTFGPSATVLSPELVLQLRVPLFVGLAPSTLVRAPGVHALDGSGAATIPYVNSTGTPGLWALQLVLLDASLRLAGTSTVATL